MKSKFISLILSVAVIAGLMMVPAAPVALAQSSDWGYEIQPSTIKVGFGENFNVTVRAECSAGQAADTFQLLLDFNPAHLQVVGITRPATLPNPPDNSAPDGYPGEPTMNNTAGWVYDGYGVPPMTATINTSFDAWTVEFQSQGVSTTTGVSFAVVNPYSSSQVILAGGDKLNWTKVVNGTVTIGRPTMTATLNPLIPVAPNVTYAAGGLSMAFNGSWIVPCLIPDTAAPYDNMTVYYNETHLLPVVTNWSWDECFVVAALDMVPGWGWVSWTGDAGQLDSSYTHALGFLVNFRVMKMDSDKNLTANFAPKAPLVYVAPALLDFETFEGTNPGDEVLVVTNAGGGTLAWTGTEDSGGWLSLAPTNGNLTTSFTVGSEPVTVSVNVTGLSAGDYSANITISGSSNQTIPVDLKVKPATAVDSCRSIEGSGDSGNPEETTELYAGETFDVYVNFTAPPTSPNHGFNAIGLTDTAPDGWEVTVDQSWCWVDGSPSSALKVQAIGNKAEIMLAGPFNEGTTLSVMYQVTVPATATPGINSWEVCDDMTESWLEYYFNEEGPYTNCIGCDYQVVVTQPGDLVGETREVNSAELPDVEVRLFRVAGSPAPLRSDISTPLYVNTAYVGGEYWMTANLTRWYELDISDGAMLPGADFTIDLSTPALLVAGLTFDFEGDYGLIPRACTMSYALGSINLWKIGRAANPEWDLSEWKAMDVCNSWLYPS